jgi:rSAM/selenodomain-associated transferase 2
LAPEVPALSIIIPVLNESAGINDLVAHLRAADSEGKAEIIVVDGDPDGGTVDTIDDLSVAKVKSSRGRGKQMNEGAKIAKGKLLLFLHADTELPPEAFSLIATAMGKGKFVGGAFDLAIKSVKLPFRLIELMASLRSRATRIPFGDQAIFIGSAYFRTIGGFPEIPLMEDVELMRRIKKEKNRICIVRQKVMTSARRWEKEGILRCTLRNWLLQILYYSGVSPFKLARWYR